MTLVHLSNGVEADMAEVTPAEVDRRVDRLEKDTRERFRAVDDRMTDHLVPSAVYDVSHAALVERVKDLESDRLRAAQVRAAIIVTVLGALVTSVGALIVALLISSPHG